MADPELIEIVTEETTDYYEACHAIELLEADRAYYEEEMNKFKEY